MLDPLRLRPSSLTTYADCARRWAAHNLSGWILGAGYQLRQINRHIGAATGTATHAGSTWALERKMETGELGSVLQAEQIAVAALDLEIEPGVYWDELTQDKSTAARQVERQTRSFLRHVGARMMPLMVERRLEAVRPTGTVVSGQIDVVVDEVVNLNDIKTGKRRRDNAVQYGTYSQLLRANGKPVGGILEHWVPRKALRAEQPPPTTVAYDMRAAERAANNAMRRAERDAAEWQQHGEPEAFLANPASPLCAEKFCPAWGTTFCTHWRKD